MNWPKLLSYKRFGASDNSEKYDTARPPWQVDYDRIVFSSAFRRLQDKTQVFPLSGTDYVRTRLTHSLEVSTVARTIGTKVGREIIKIHGHLQYEEDGTILRNVINPSDIGTICATGALAHDIGNPPFGHSGEDSIRHWFSNSVVAKQFRKKLTAKQALEFDNWEGNAEGFRILSRLQMVRNKGGLKLTAASLGAYTKYPASASAVSKLKRDNPSANLDQAAKKPGFFEDDRKLWESAAVELGLVKNPKLDYWCRHPLAYITEVADDICYRIIDLEDGFRIGRISYLELESLFLKAAGQNAAKKVNKLSNDDEIGKATYLRSLVFSEVVEQVVKLFIENESEFLIGSFKGDILKKLPSRAAFEEMKQLAVNKVYSTPNVIEIEAAGFEIIPGLLDAYAGAIIKSKKEIDLKGKKLLSLIPNEFLDKNRQPNPDPYIQLLQVIDFVSGMTDSFALTQYRRIKGVSLPG